MKGLADGNFRTAWGGVAGLSLTLPVVWTAMRQRGLPLKKLASWMAEAPARLAGLDHCKGPIAAGYDADLVVFAPEETFLAVPEQLHYLHPISPYVGERLTGVVHQTILRGLPVFRGSEFEALPRGREVPG